MKFWFVLLGVVVCGLGCETKAEAEDYYYPPIYPLCLVEHDHESGAYILNRDRLPWLKPLQKAVLVLPLYDDYSAEGKQWDHAVAHPFLYRPVDDLEKQLVALGQREKLHRLIVWVPGYFPNGIGRAFRIDTSLIIGQKTMTVAELQRCENPHEEQDLSRAMRSLLQEKQFVIGRNIAIKAPPYSTFTTDTHWVYAMDQMVRTEEFDGRFWRNGCSTKQYVLWGLNAGTVVHLLLTEADRKMLDAFFTQLEAKPTSQPATKSTTTASLKKSLKKKSNKKATRRNDTGTELVITSSVPVSFLIGQ